MASKKTKKKMCKRLACTARDGKAIGGPHPRSFCLNKPHKPLEYYSFHEPAKPPKPRGFTPRSLGLSWDDYNEGATCTDPKCWHSFDGDHPRCQCHPEEFDRPCLDSHDRDFDDTPLEADKFNLVALGDDWFAVIQLDFGRTSLRSVRPKKATLEWQYMVVSRRMRYEAACRKLVKLRDEDENAEKARRRRLMPRVRRARLKKAEEAAGQKKASA